MKKLVTLALVLVMVSGLAAAATVSQSYGDGPAHSTEWSQSSYSGDLAQQNYNGTSSDISLRYNQETDNEGGFGDVSNGDGDISTDESSISLKRGSSSGDRNGLGSEIPESRQAPGSAYANGNMWFLGDELWKFEGTGDPPGFFGSCDIASNIPGQPRGLADNGGPGVNGFAGGDLIISGRDTVVSTTNFYVYDYGSCSKDKIASVTNEEINRGISYHESDPQSIYGIAGGANTIYDINLDTGDVNSEINIPNGNQRGLDIKEWSDGTVWFIVSYTGGSGEEEIQVIEKSTGNVVRTFTSGNGESYAALWNDHPNEQRIFTTTSNNELTAVTPVNLWAGDGEGRVQYGHTWDTDSSTKVTEISWSGEAPSGFKGTGGKIKLEVKDDSGSWQTVDSYNAGTGSFSNSISLGSSYNNMGELSYRVDITDNYKIRGSSSNPKVTDVSWDFEYYSDSGTVSSTPIDTGSVSDFQTLTFNGSSGGENFDVTILDKNGNVEYSQENVAPNQELDLSSVPADFSTEQVEVRFGLQSSGLTSPSLSGYDLNYEVYDQPEPEITSWSAEVAGRETTDTSVQTVTGSKDTFTIQQVDQSVDEVRWYVDDELVKNESVSGDGPFTFNKTWQEEGDHRVVGVVEANNVVDDQQWEVTTGRVAIQGKDSYSNQFFTTTQIFKVYEDPDGEIDYRIDYNESVVELVTGQTRGTVTSGGSITVDFQVKQENYTGQPITITAEYKNTEVSKKITVSSVRDSGSALGGPLLGGNGDGRTFLTNTWSDFLPLGDNPSVYILLQGIIGIGFFAVIWLNHLGIPSLPGFVNPVTNLPFWTKLLVSIDGALLITGLGLVPWGIILIGLSGVIWWRWLRDGFSLTRVVSSI